MWAYNDEYCISKIIECLYLWLCWWSFCSWWWMHLTVHFRPTETADLAVKVRSARTSVKHHLNQWCLQMIFPQRLVFSAISKLLVAQRFCVASGVGWLLRSLTPSRSSSVNSKASVRVASVENVGGQPPFCPFVGADSQSSGLCGLTGTLIKLEVEVRWMSWRKLLGMIEPSINGSWVMSGLTCFFHFR